MDISSANLLDEIQNLRGALEQWGVTYELLICLGVAAFAMFLISLREIVVWYLRISQLHAQLHKMSEQLSQIQSSVNQAQVAPSASNNVPVFQETQEEQEPQTIAARKKFHLDH